MGSLILQFGMVSRLHGRTKMSSSSSTSNRSSPWLMLPPTLDRRGGGMAYNFYSLADDEVVVLNKYGGGADPVESPDDDARVVGSSHGWLALMNRRNNDLFLSNPVSRRHIKLPAIDALPDPEINLSLGGSVSKLILSASPDAASECRAMMSFGPCDRLAICRPSRSKAWTPIGDLFLESDDVPTHKYAWAYEDFVYSSGLFSCVLALSDVVVLEEWDPRIPATKRKLYNFTSEEWDPRIPRIHWSSSSRYKWLDGEKGDKLRNCSEIMKHLAYVEARDELLLLFRYAHKGTTVGFIVARVEEKEEEEEEDEDSPEGDMRLVGSSLEGLAVFVGTNHSFALSAEEFPHLKPNCIYFTDNKELYTPWHDLLRKNFRGGDVGIFDCVHGTFSSCYYPLHQTNTIVPAPIWFTPTLP